jgi:hypothetical protein
MATAKRHTQNPACMKRFSKLEEKVFNGLEAKLDVVKEKVAGLEKITYAVFTGILLVLAASVIRMIFKV